MSSQFQKIQSIMVGRLQRSRKAHIGTNRKQRKWIQEASKAKYSFQGHISRDLLPPTETPPPSFHCYSVAPSYSESIKGFTH